MSAAQDGRQAHILPIGTADIPAVAHFLHRELNNRLSADRWATAIRPPWPATGPDHGVFLQFAGEVVGVYLAFYSRREVRGRSVDFCNLGAWCVREDFRHDSFRLLLALLGRRGYVFTDLSPSGDVVPMNEKLGFQHLDTATSITPHLPFLPGPRGVRIHGDGPELTARLAPELARLHQEHRGALAARHLLLEHEGRSCYVVYRTVRRKNLPVFAALLFVSDPPLLQRCMPSVGRYLLRRHGLLMTLSERFVLPHPPALSRALTTPRRKMFKASRGAEVGAEDIDNLYSELVCVPW